MSERATVHLRPGELVDLVVDAGAGTRITYSATITSIDTNVSAEYVRAILESHRMTIGKTPENEDA